MPVPITYSGHLMSLASTPLIINGYDRTEFSTTANGVMAVFVDAESGQKYEMTVSPIFEDNHAGEHGADDWMTEKENDR